MLKHPFYKCLVAARTPLWEEWSVDTPLRKDEERRAAQAEIDANGRKVPKGVVKADAKLKDSAQLSVSDRAWTNPQSGVECVYECPFRQLDREEDMQEAYARFD